LEFRLIKNNSIFQNLNSIEIGPVPYEVLALFSVNWKDDWKLAMQQIRKINDTFYQHLAKTDAFDKAIIQLFDHALQDFENIIDEGIPAMSLKSFKHLFQQHWNTKSIAFYGNSLDGL